MSHGSAIPAVSNSFNSAPRLKSVRKRHGRQSAPLIHHCKSTMWTTSPHTQRLWMCWLMGQDLTHTPSQAPGNARYDRCPPKIHFHCEAWEIPRQLSALTLYRCEQSVLDYCHAHLSLHLNMGMDPTTQELGGPRPAGYHSGLMAALPSETVLPCPQTHSLHQWAVHSVRLCV